MQFGKFYLRQSPEIMLSLYFLQVRKVFKFQKSLIKSIILFQLQYMRGRQYDGHSYHYNQSTNRQNQNQNQMSRNIQKVIQDQNYSNETFFMMLSSLQSIIIFYEKKGYQYKNKMFKNYDKFDYSTKSLKQLKSQLNIHVFLFQGSKIVWMQENPHEQWRLPNNFNEQNAINFVNYAINVFQQNNDQESVKMAKDILTLLGGRVTDLHIDKLKIDVEYSQQQKKNFQKNIFGYGMNANQQMIRLGQESKQYQNPEQLKARINEQNNFQMKDVHFQNRKMQQQLSITTKGSQLPTEKVGISQPIYRRLYLFCPDNVKSIQNIKGLKCKYLMNNYGFKYMEWDQCKAKALSKNGYRRIVQILVDQNQVICQRGDPQVLY